MATSAEGRDPEQRTGGEDGGPWTWTTANQIPRGWRRQHRRARTPQASRGGATAGRRLMTRRSRRRSRHFLESPAGAARCCTQLRSREPAAAAMSHQTGIQGNGARRGPRKTGSGEASGEPGGLRAGQGQSRVRSAGSRSRGVAGPQRPSALSCPGRSGPASLPDPAAATLQTDPKFAGAKEVCFLGVPREGGVPSTAPDITPTFPFLSGREDLKRQIRRLGLLLLSRDGRIFLLMVQRRLLQDVDYKRKGDGMFLVSSIRVLPKLFRVFFQNGNMNYVLRNPEYGVF